MRSPTRVCSLLRTLLLLAASRVAAIVWSWDRSSAKEASYFLHSDAPGGGQAHHVERNLWLERLRDKTIFWAGDSVSRYQYLNLAFYLQSGRWITNPPYVEHEWEWVGGKGEWADFMKVSSIRLGCLEVCDCWRDKGSINMKENRHFYEPRVNLTIRFFAWFPPAVPRGNRFPTPDDFVSRCGNRSAWADDLATWEDGASWRFADGNFSAFVEQIVAPAQPDVFILNFGIWGDMRNDIIGGDAAAAALVDAFRRSSVQPIWRTTSPHGDGSNLDRVDAILPLMQAAGIEVYDVRAMLAPVADRPSFAADTAYWDMVHLKAFAYREVNLQLLQMIAKPRGNATKHGEDAKRR